MVKNIRFCIPKLPNPACILFKYKINNFGYTTDYLTEFSLYVEQIKLFEYKYESERYAKFNHINSEFDNYTIKNYIEENFGNIVQIDGEKIYIQIKD